MEEGEEFGHGGGRVGGWGGKIGGGGEDRVWGGKRLSFVWREVENERGGEGGQIGYARNELGQTVGSLVSGSGGVVGG